MSSRDVATDRVERGARLLDRAQPGWYHDVSPKALSMGWCRQCVIGQLFEDYYYGLKEVGINPDKAFEERLFGFEADSYTTSGGTVEITYDLLDDLWRGEIQKRRETKNLTTEGV